MNATHELHGVVMHHEHVALAWCVRFAGQIKSCNPKAEMGSLHFNVHFSGRLTHEPCLYHGEKFVLGSEQEEDSDHGHVFGPYLFWASRKALRNSLWEHLVVVWYAEVSKRRLREDAADPISFNSIRGTPRRWLPDDEPREPREPREQPLRIDVRLCAY